MILPVRPFGFFVILALSAYRELALALFPDNAALSILRTAESRIPLTRKTQSATVLVFGKPLHPFRLQSTPSLSVFPLVSRMCFLHRSSISL